MTLNLVQGRSLAAMPDQGDKAEEPATAASCEKRPIPEEPQEGGPSLQIGEAPPISRGRSHCASCH